MIAVGDMLKPAEAAVVARTALRDVNRTIDEHILPDTLTATEDGRRVMAAACALISFYVASASQLSVAARLATIRDAAARLLSLRANGIDSIVGEAWTSSRDGFLTIDLSPFMRSMKDGLEQLDAARAAVESDPEILGGTPVIRGTRIPVYDVAASLDGGIPPDRIREAYPSLDERRIELARTYVAANPLRGRPRATAAIPPGAVVIADRRVPRRQIAE